MPLYDYVNVKDEKDIVEKFFQQGENVPDTINIKRKKYKRIPSRSSFKFRGSGFHATDY